MSGTEWPVEVEPPAQVEWPVEDAQIPVAASGTGSVSWGDWGRSAWAGLNSFGGAVAGALEYGGEATGVGGGAARAVREMFQGEADYQVQAMGPEARTALGSSMLPGENDDNFWEAPLRGLGMKAMNTLPSMAASIFPAAIVARGMSAAGASIGAVRAGAGGAVGATNFAASSGEVFATMADEFGKLTEEEKLKGSPTYSALRESGMDDEEATRRTIQEAADMKPLFAGMIAAAAGFGLTGRAVGDIATGGTRGLVAGMRQGAIAEGAEEAVQTGAEEGFTQFGMNELTGKPLSLREFAASVIEGTVLGAGMGGAFGGVGGALAPARGPDPAQQAALNGQPVTPPSNPNAPPPVTDPDDDADLDDDLDDDEIDPADVLDPPNARPPAGPTGVEASIQAGDILPAEPAPAVEGMAASQDNPPAKPDQASRPGANVTRADKGVNLTGMGAGIADSLHDMLWGKLQAGDTTELGRPSPVLVAAKAAMDAGTIKTREDFTQFANSGQWRAARTPQNNIADADQLAALAGPGQTGPASEGALTPEATAPAASVTPTGNPPAPPAPQLPVAPVPDVVQNEPAPVPQPAEAAPAGDVTPLPPQPPTGPGPAAPPATPQQAAPQASAPVTPPSKPKLTAPQQGALQKLEGRAQAIARAEKVPDDLFDEILADLRNELEPQLAGQTGGASEIMQRLVEQLDMRALVQTSALKALERQAAENDYGAVNRKVQAARKGGRGAERTTKDKVAEVREDADWRTMQARAKRLAKEMGENTPEAIREVADYAAPRGGSAAQRAERAAQKEALKTGMVKAERDAADRAAKAAKKAEADKPPTLQEILDGNQPPEGREKLADYNMRMARIVNNAQQAGVDSPFIRRLMSLGSKEGGITRAEMQLLQVDEFKLRAEGEVAKLDAEQKKLDAEIAVDGAQQRALKEFKALGSKGRMVARSEFADDGAAPGWQTLDYDKMTPVKVEDLADAMKTVAKSSPAARSLMLRLLPHTQNVRVFTVPRGQLMGADGVTTYREMEAGGIPIIFVEDGLSADRMVEVVMHEAVHAATSIRLHLDKELNRKMGKLLRLVSDNLNYFKTPYRLSSVHEFTAHALTNTDFQEELAAMHLPRALAAELGIRTSPSVWDGFVSLIKKALGIDRNDTVLEAVIRLTGTGFTPVSKQQEMIQARVAARNAPPDNAILAGTQSVLTNAASYGQSLMSAAPDMVRANESRIRSVGLGFMTASDIVETFGNLFGWTPTTKANSKATHANPLAQVQNALARQGVRARELREGADPIVKALNKLAKDDPETAKALDALMQEATAYAIHPDVPLTDPKNKHLTGKDKRYWQSAANHPRLAAEYAKLVRKRPEVAAIWKDMAGYFSKSHKAMGRMLVKNLLENRHFQQVRVAQRANTPLPAEPDFDKMTERFLTNKATDQDRDWLGESMTEHVKQVRRLARVAGPYFPQRRFGDFVVQWKETGKDEHVFATEADARKFAEKSDLLVTGVSKRQYDAAGKLLSASDLKDPNVVAAKTEHVVKVQDDGLEFFDTQREAEERRRELQGQKKHIVSEVERRRQQEGISMELMPDQLRGLVRSVGRMEIGEDRIALTQRAIEEAAMRLLPGTSAKSALLRRRNVIGASQDTVRATAAYANASSNYLAKLEYAPVVHAGLDGMEQFILENRYDNTGKTIARQEVFREIQARQRLDAIDLTGGGSASRIVRTLQSMSFVNFLASPAYTLINLMQQMLVTAPYLGARYGDWKTAKAMASANSAIFGKVMLGGAKQFAEAVKGSGDTVDFMGIVRDQINKGLAADKAELIDMLKHLTDNGLIDLSAGMELTRAGNPRITLAGKALQWTEDIARAMPAAAEVVNRSGSAIAAYRLARAESNMTHAQAKDFALEAVRKTQFDYTAANTARFMDARRSPILALAMTFRKYAQGMYMLLGRSVVTAFKGATPQERSVARKTLARLMISHMTMAGALGLPLEPIKVALGIVNFAFGGDEPWDYEKEVRQGLADVLGVETAEVITRGLPRYFGADLSGRVGLDSLLFAKGLDDYKPKTIQTAMFELIGGAPASMLLQPIAAMEHLRNDDPLRAAEMLVPKGVRDVLKATRFGSEGIQTKRGEQIDPGLGGGELFWQALGIQPAKVAEMYERRDAIKGAETRLTDRRQRLMRRYADADPSERHEVWTEIREWNAEQNPDARVTMGQLLRSMQERKRRVRDARDPQAAGTFLPANRRFLYREGEFADVN